MAVKELVQPGSGFMGMKKVSLTAPQLSSMMITYSNSILDPGAKIVLGYENVVMPPTGKNMNEQQVQDVIEFIKSLSEVEENFRWTNTKVISYQ